MASLSVDLLIGKIISIIENEASLIVGLNDELSEMKHELVSMRSFLEDADRKRGLTEGEKAWVRNVRDIACKIEDIINEIMYQMNKQEQRGKFTRLLHQAICFPKNLWVRHQMGTKLQKINKEIKSIPERRQRYGIDRIEGKSSFDDHKWLQNHGDSSLSLKDDDLVGIEDGRQVLEGWLMDKEPQRTVISVVGMGGSGKTTLVANAYKSEIVKQHFDCYAWITISQTYFIEEIFRIMIKEFHLLAKEAVPIDLSTMRRKQLLEMLVSHLRPKRYVVVLDDVWSGNLWRDINVSLPDEGLGSRVVLTTRKEDIASSSFGVKSHVHHLKPLGVTEAWELFCMKAFSNNPNSNCPQELEISARDIVEKCEGLPLAIVALGAAMSSKKMESEWRRVYSSLNWELSNNPMLEGVKNTLLLSFTDLPYRLKRCFLYCCAFPEDHHIRRKRLIRLWMAEGFIEKVKGITPEEVADGYLMELIYQNMLQVKMRNPSGRPKEFKVHDFLREIALSTSETERFCAASSEEGELRCLSIHTDGELKSWKGMSQLHSLLVFAADNISPSLKTLPSGFRLLRVLDLEDVPIVKLPDELVDLFNLRYLNLRRTKVKELPKSIGRLCNLQSLDIAGSKIEVLPTGITKLQNLRHLITYCVNHGYGDEFCFAYSIPAPPNICTLKNLQVLTGVQAKADLLKQVRSMTQLTRIGITMVRERDEEDLCISIQNMNLLSFLCVHAIDEEEYLRMDLLSSTPPCLKTLTLAGKLEKVPHWFHSLQSITTLHMHWSRLSENLLPYIQALPSLSQLTLVNAYTGNQLWFCTGFQKLTELWLVSLPQLNQIIIENGVMPGLRKLFLSKCMELKMLPHGVEYLRNLQELNLAIVSNELTERIRGEGSVDHPKVRHIPKINHYYQSPSGMFYESLS